MFSLESPHRGDSNKNTQYTIFNMNKKNTLNYPKSAALEFFPRDSRTEFETAVVNEPPVFEPLKFYYILNFITKKTNYASVPIELAFLRYQCIMALKMIKYKGICPSIKYYKSFLNNLIFASNLFKNSKA